MNSCTEFAIFKVTKENMPKVIALSLAIINEINAHETVVTSHKILQKTDNQEEICWQLTWINQKAVKLTTEKWSSFPSTQALESLVGEKIYYGHFIELNKID